MLKNPRVYLKALAGWLVLTNFGHTFLGIPALLNQAADSKSGNFQVLSAMNLRPKGGFFEYNFFDLFFFGHVGNYTVFTFCSLGFPMDCL